ncbi:MAG: hypothetical protein OXE76_16400, partial [Alphaproteobacteria bacterium]|nr:hypothetical protein [Alphaproteobacteria bacterium]
SEFATERPRQFRPGRPRLRAAWRTIPSLPLTNPNLEQKCVGIEKLEICKEVAVVAFDAGSIRARSSPIGPLSLTPAGQW